MANAVVIDGVRISRRTGLPVGKQGGRRNGAGRKKGHTTKMHRVQHYIEKFPIMPLDHMLEILNTPIPVNTKKDERLRLEARQDDMARAAAPFLHARLQSVALTGADGGPIRHSIDITKLSDEELMLFERLISKSQIITLAKDEYEETKE